MKYDFENVIDRSALGSSKWNEMREANPDVPAGIVPLSVADMELKCAPEIMAGLREYLNPDLNTLGYSTTTAAYDEAVRGWMKRRHGWEIDMSWNVLSPGVVTALFCAVRAYTEPGEGVIIFSPVYYPFRMAIEQSGRRVADVPLIAGDARYEIDWEAFELAAQSSANRLLLLCSPHNPVGRVWSEQELRRLSEICLANDVLVISDEIHNDLIMPGHRHTVYAKLSPEAEQSCVICTSPSKSFSLAGLQTSNILVPNSELREKLRQEYFAAALFAVNAIGIKACEIAYTQCDEWLAGAIDLISSNARLVENYLAANIPEIRVYPLEGTYLQWWDCRELFDDYRELETFMRMKAHIFADEGHIFGEGGQGFERINLACPASVLEEALHRLSGALRERQMHTNEKL